MLLYFYTIKTKCYISVCLQSLFAEHSYLGLFALQLLPSLLIGYKLASFVYFGLLAVSTVYLGSKRMDIPDVSCLRFRLFNALFLLSSRTGTRQPADGGACVKWMSRGDLDWRTSEPFA